MGWWWPGGKTPGGGEERIISAGAFIININSSYCDDYIIIRLQLLTGRLTVLWSPIQSTIPLTRASFFSQLLVNHGRVCQISCDIFRIYGLS